MARAEYDEIKKEHAPDCTCSFCGQKYKVFPFKNGYVCEDCVDYVKTAYSDEKKPDSDNR